jgi:hypothetical protein
MSLPYNVEKVKNNATYQCSETYMHRIIIRDTEGTIVYPTTVKFNLYDMCGNVLVADGAMATDADGTYEYLYSVPADCLYGEYDIRVEATAATGEVFIYPDSFYIFPWKCLEQIRSVSGIAQRKTIDDNDLAKIAWDAYQEVLNEVYEFHDWEKVKCDPNVNLLFDGTNKTFRINVCNYDELADRFGDGQVTGWGETSCGTDVDGYWIDSNYARHQLKITVEDVITGRVTLSQTDGTAVPASHNGVRVNYATQSELWNERRMRKAVVYLAAHEVVQQFNMLDRVTLADVESNKAVFLASPNRLEKIYKKARDSVRDISFGGCK